ncbi:pseudouridine synthase [Piptocephalis cylindrospora]|uniref:Pseudouridine synthase n=1 Tax=Piptocephalis cylindrospora TaxID=1907219 RepID=A0A4P9Y4B4_9FUNG|nr:pseudouridine synthase [Piptocephalis cylindrospora]|eukprot:RKP13818.1 pseudouridine synthase [Piptocephalis cylindrospora]
MEGDKVKRTRQHQRIKTWSHRKLITSTVDGCVVVRRGRAQDIRDDQRRSRASKGPAFTKAILYKFDRDSMDAVSLLARTLRIPPRAVSLAGTKDRRACTSQAIVFQRIHPSKLASANTELNGLRLGNFSSSRHPLRLGDLQGNHFTLVLRHVRVHPDSTWSLDQSLKSLRDDGFINYFGMQRFGTGPVPTHHIGRAILQNDWEGVYHLLMLPRDGETEDIASARRRWFQTRDAQEALASFPRRHTAERSILRAFSEDRHSHDYCGAIRTIPRNLRSMYLHAYQSYIWNSMCSLRLASPDHFKPMVGDLVPMAAGADGPLLDSRVSRGDQGLHFMTHSLITSSFFLQIKNVHILTEKDDLSKYNIADVLLPLPGFDVLYPTHFIGEKYREYMLKDGLDPERMRRSIREYSLSGAYRHILCRPANLSWKTMQYEDDKAPLILSDADILDGIPEPEENKNGQHMALILSLTLGTSQYATMALRELLRVDSSSEHHILLSQAIQPTVEESDTETKHDE